MTRSSARAALVVGALASAGAAALPAQGTLSTQGFGYPPGQVSARSRATGGAMAEFDPSSPVNPAATAAWGRPGLYFEYGPEFRRVTMPEEAGTGGGGNRTTLIRFPLVIGAVNIGSRAVASFSASTLLDRTWRTDVRIVDTIAGQELRSTEIATSEGAINDIRLAFGYQLTQKLRLGIGLHALSGENRVTRQREFDDTTQAIPFRQAFPVSYSGKMVSAGVQWRPVKQLTLALSGRTGGRLTAWREDTVKGRAHTPRRFGAAVEFAGLTGASIVAGVDRENWSSFSGLAVGDVEARDATTYRIGAEVKGPRWFGSDIPLRLGWHWRDLPFGSADARFKEQSFAGGLGLPVAHGRANIDFTLEHARRRQSGATNTSPRENALILGIGLGIRL